MSQGWFWSAAIGLLTMLAAVQTLTMRQESQTWDEAFEIASGYSYLKTGDYRISVEQPPFGRVVSALPLLFLHLSVPLDQESWRESNDVQFGNAFLYHNVVPAQRILLWARTTTVLTTLCLGLAMALWTRAEFGSAAGLFALTLFSFDPNIIAYGRYAKNDMLVTLLSFLACLAWTNWLRRKKRGSLWLTGILFGLAVGTKFSAGFLLPVFVILALSWHGLKRGTIKKWARPLLGVAATGCLVLLLIYAPSAKLLIPITRSSRLADPSIRMLRDAVDVRMPSGWILRWMGSHLGLRAHPLLVGLNRLATHNFNGHLAYLLGMLSDHGWWYYFPVAWAVKTPVATLLVAALAAGLALWRRKRPEFIQIILLAPIAVYLCLSMVTHIDIGLRHLLPIFPFLFALLGIAMSRWRTRYAVALCALLALESFTVYPNYLAFFNAATGGPANGPRYLLDSNIDWGQDLIKLRTWMDRHNAKRVRVAYFGTADRSYYGVDGAPAPATLAEGQEADCYVAISVTWLYGLYVKPDQYAWLRETQPVAKIGYSIYVYDLRKHPQGRDATTIGHEPAARAVSRSRLSSRK